MFVRIVIVSLVVLWQAMTVSTSAEEDTTGLTHHNAREAGKRIYEERCVECHGPEGRGDGPRAPLLAPRPGSLVSAATSSKSDRELLRILSNGVPRTAMRGYKQHLSENELILVLSYVRSLIRFQQPSLTPPPPVDVVD